jgi:hypothetical protein
MTAAKMRKTQIRITNTIRCPFSKGFDSVGLGGTDVRDVAAIEATSFGPSLMSN